MSQAMYDVKLLLSLKQGMCPICFRPLPFAWDSLTRIGDGHHVIVRRGAFEDDLLWVPENIVLVHHSCHMREGQATIHECAMLIRRFGGTSEIEKWHYNLPWRGREGGFPAAWITATKYYGLGSVIKCPRCGVFSLHSPITGQALSLQEPGVCWNCFNLTGA
jgi:hypothetical protein